ncbi:hypothetical protein ACE6H2_020371 [Prunus campanulata]
MCALVYMSNEILTRMQLGSTQFYPSDPRSQAHLSLRIDLVRDLSLGPQGEERRMDECTGRRFERSQTSRTGPSRQGEGQERATQCAYMSQAPLKVDQGPVQD